MTEVMDLLEICDELGGIRNAIDLLNQYKIDLTIYQFNTMKGKDIVFDSCTYNDAQISIYYDGRGDGIFISKNNYVVENVVFFENYLRSSSHIFKIKIKIKNVDDDFKENILSIYNKIKNKKEERRFKMREIDPYGEEDWLDEKTRIITKFKIFEELSNPYDNEPIVFSQHFQNNYDGFKQEFIDDLKAKLTGTIIYIDAERNYGWQDKKDPIDEIFIDGKHLKPIYRITVKDVLYDGTHRQDIYYIQIITDDNKSYKLKKIVDVKTYNRWLKKAEKELERIAEEELKKEKMKIKHFYHDPYGEENWEDDD